MAMLQWTIWALAAIGCAAIVYHTGALFGVGWWAVIVVGIIAVVAGLVLFLYATSRGAG